MTTENVISAFTEEQAERLTGISARQLRYWDRTRYFVPEFASENRRDAYSRLYSFKNIAALRVLNVLRNQHNVPLQHLRKVAIELADMSDEMWLAREMFVLSKRVIFVEPDTDQYREIVSKQYVIGLPLRVVISDTRKDVESLGARDESQIGQVSRGRNIGHNVLVIAGTRVPVATIKRFVEDGHSTEEILKEFPRLTAADVRAAIEHKGDDLAA
jgi:uncharacterized protein (DUF433 family)/DNA-binding transcriptional MerR regulator